MWRLQSDIVSMSRVTSREERDGHGCDDQNRGSQYCTFIVSLIFISEWCFCWILFVKLNFKFFWWKLSSQITFRSKFYIAFFCLYQVLGQTTDHRHRVLVLAAKNIKNWFIKVKKIKAIYHTLNMFNLDVTQKCLIAECWVATADLDKVHHALRRGQVSLVHFMHCNNACNNITWWWYSLDFCQAFKKYLVCFNFRSLFRCCTQSVSVSCITYLKGLCYIFLSAELGFWIVDLYRSEVEVQYLLFSIEWQHHKNLQPTIEPISSLKSSRIW